MRKLIENPVYMTYEEIEREFDGKWIYVIKCDYTPYSEMLGGYPVVVADIHFEGHENGFYDQFRILENGMKTDIDLRHHEPSLVNLGLFF